VERNEETHQIVLWCTGEAHADVVLARLRASGATVEVTDVAVPERETVAGPASGLGRHVKQSGGHGQFAVCRIEIEPLPRGSGVEFVDKIVGGVIPRAYIPGVEKGVRAQLEAGVTPGRPVVDVRVTLVDGKAHSVDSSDQAFQTAGSLAIKEAVAAAGTVVMERLYEVEVTVDDSQLGTVLGDLASRHGRVVGTEPGEGGTTVVRAEVPEQALLRYAVDLRALTSGTASFTRRFSRYEPVAGA
jgi:elongation factor G